MIQEVSPSFWFSVCIGFPTTDVPQPDIVSRLAAARQTDHLAFRSTIVKQLSRQMSLPEGRFSEGITTSTKKGLDSTKKFKSEKQGRVRRRGLLLLQPGGHFFIIALGQADVPLPYLIWKS